jgi:hypothetical protein
MAEEKTKRVVVRQAGDPELLVMGRIERMLRSVKDGAARNRIAYWVATRDWADKPIKYMVTPQGDMWAGVPAEAVTAGQTAGKAAE